MMMGTCTGSVVVRARHDEAQLFSTSVTNCYSRPSILISPRSGRLARLLVKISARTYHTAHAQYPILAGKLRAPPLNRRNTWQTEKRKSSPAMAAQAAPPQQQQQQLEGEEEEQVGPQPLAKLEVSF